MRVCPICRSEFTIEARKRNLCCSKPCSQKLKGINVAATKLAKKSPEEAEKFLLQKSRPKRIRGEKIGEEELERRKIARLEKNGGKWLSEESIEKTKKTRLGNNGGVWIPEEEKNRARNTRLERYGTYQAKEAYEKGKQTLKLRTGYEHALQNPQSYGKLRGTNLDRYGVEIAMHNRTIKERVISTNLEKYGVENPMQNAEVIIRSQETKGRNRPEIYDQIKQFAWWEENYIGKNTTIGYLCEKHGFSGSTATKATSDLKVPVINQMSTSRIEQKFSEAISSLGVEVIRSCKSIIRPLELDIFIPSHNLAIEVNGLYWHSEITGNKKKEYHANKKKLCSEAGVTLVQFWDIELENKFDICLSMIKSRLGLNEKIAGRVCSVQRVDSRQASDFVMDNHVSGYRDFQEAIGLFYEGELLSLGLFGKSVFRRGCMELIRFCTKKGFTVVGGFQKILKRYEDVDIVSYSDGRYSDGDVYLKSGFDLLSDNGPTPWYTKDYDVLKHRYIIAKKVYPELTQWESAKKDGWDRVWDAGQKTWFKEATTVKQSPSELEFS